MLRVPVDFDPGAPTPGKLESVMIIAVVFVVACFALVAGGVSATYSA